MTKHDDAIVLDIPTMVEMTPVTPPIVGVTPTIVEVTPATVEVTPTMVDMSSANETQSGRDSEKPSADCRICLETDNLDKLVAPCDCQGSVQYVHPECIRKWCRERASLRCEICNRDYDMDSLQEGDRAKILDAVQAAQAEQAVERHNRRQLRRGLNPGDPWGSFEGAIRSVEMYEREDSEERVAQVRRLVMFAVLVTVTMLMFHLIGSLLLSNAMEADHLQRSAVAPVTATTGLPGEDNENEQIRDKGSMPPAVSRIIRVLIFFYIIRSLVFRQPEYGDRRDYLDSRPGPRGTRGIDLF